MESRARKRALFAKKRRELISRIENSKRPLWQFAAIFAAAFVVRSFIEPLSTKEVDNPLALIHYLSFYVSTALSLILVLSVAARTAPKKTAKIVLPFFAVIIIPPVIDLIITAGAGLRLAYIDPRMNVLFSFLTLGGTPYDGITFGIKTELIIVMVLCMYYLVIKRAGMIRAIIGTFLAYLVIFLHLGMTFVLAPILVQFVSFGEDVFAYLIVSFFLFIILADSVLLLFVSNRKLFRAVILDIRPTRTIHFVALFFAGVLVISGKAFPTGSFAALLSLLYIPLSIIYAFMFSVIQNNIHDTEIDNVSNKKRPLQLKAASIEEYRLVSYAALFFALAFSAICGPASFAAIILFIALYYAYSNPPLRLKRIPLLSKLIVSGNSLLMVVLGFLVAGGSISEFPIGIAALFLVGFTLAINFIDIKDYAGDKKAGIKTLPVLLGLRKSKLIIGFFFAIAYALAYFAIGKPWLLLPIAAFALIEFLLINNPKYDERQVLIVYLASLVALAAHL